MSEDPQLIACDIMIEGHDNPWVETFEKYTNDENRDEVAIEVSDLIDAVWSNVGYGTFGEEAKDFYDYLESGICLGIYQLP